MTPSHPNNVPTTTISIIIPTFRREQVLVDTLDLLAPLLHPGDEVLVVDQTPCHEPQTEEALCQLASAGIIRWYRLAKPSQPAAMNAGAWLARGAILLFLDDDVVPLPRLLEAHREALAPGSGTVATCGQVIQPWQDGPIERVADFTYDFNPAYNRPCDILGLIGCNHAIRRETYFAIGGQDENFFGATYRNDAEISYRIYRRTGTKVRFVPEAGLRHLAAGGGTRAYGTKDTWGQISSAIGDYYFALRCLPLLGCLKHHLTRFVRAPLNRNTVRHPWLIPMLFVREVVAWWRAAGRAWTQPNNYIKDSAYYAVTSPIAAAPV